MLSPTDRSNLAGEFYTLAELYRRGYNAFITLGKAKQIDIIVKEGDVSLSIEVKSRMSSGQFLCSYPSSPSVKKVWCFVDFYKKMSGSPDFYILGAQDMCDLRKFREDEMRRKAKARGKPYSKFSSLDVPLNKLKEYNRN
jgi:hypothetical protein